MLLVPVDEIPEPATLVPRDEGRVILAYGEATGHAHAFDVFAASLLEAEGGRYLKLREAAELKHEEHGAITVAPGSYQRGDPARVRRRPTRSSRSRPVHGGRTRDR